jgi:hypothetical protein
VNRVAWGRIEGLFVTEMNAAWERQELRTFDALPHHNRRSLMAVVANQALAFDKSMLVALSPSRRCASSGIDPRSRKNQKFLSSERRPTLGYRPAVAFGVSGAGELQVPRSFRSFLALNTWSPASFFDFCPLS